MLKVLAKTFKKNTRRGRQFADTLTNEREQRRIDFKHGVSAKVRNA